MAPDPVPRSELLQLVLDSEMIVSGGFIESGFGGDSVTASVAAYDPASDSWRELPEMPSQRHHGMAATVGDRLFMIGGYSLSGFNPTSTVWELIDGEWVDRLRSRPGRCRSRRSTGRFHLPGGRNPHGSFYRYDPVADTWEHLAEPSSQREHLAAVVLEGEIWALAGRWEGEIFGSTEIFDPSTGEWRAGPPMSEARSGFGAVVVDDAIYAVGGEVFDPNIALDSMERMSSGEWTLVDPFPYGIHGNPLVEIDGSLYLPGGSTEAAGGENDGRTFRYNHG